MLTAGEALIAALKAKSITPREMLEKRIEEAAARGEEYLYFGLQMDDGLKADLIAKGYKLREKEKVTKVIWGSEK